MGAFLTVAGKRFPWPNKESGLQTQITMVSEGRNAEGVFIGQKVGRDQSKVELEWYSMDAQKWAELLQIFNASFVNPVSYYDMMQGKIITRNMYVSDRSASAKRVDPATGAWLVAKNCKLSLIDTGEG